MELAEIVKASASRMVDVTVEADRGFSTVCISCDGEEDIFMQGDEADDFIAEVDTMYDMAQHVTWDEAALCVAEPYAECIWNSLETDEGEGYVH